MANLNRTLPTIARPLPRLAIANPFAWLRGQNWRLTLGFAIFLPIFFAAVLAPYLPLPDPLQTRPIEGMHGPSLEHFFGTDKLGRDIFSRTVSGARISLVVGFASAGIALFVGVIVGTIAGFLGRTVDAAISGAVDVMLSFPSLLLVLAMVSVFGNGLMQVILAIAIADAPRAIRLQRALALSLRSRAYIDAARLAEAPTWWLLVRHVLPNTVAPMIVVASIYAANAILAEASLSFLGLGIRPPEPSWGNIIADGRVYLEQAWWISTFPGLAIIAIAVALHFISDGLREKFDPREHS